MKKFRLTLSLFFLTMLFAPSLNALPEGSTFTIGVLSTQEKSKCIHQWQATALELNDKIGGVHFTILPINYDEVRDVVKNKRIDFLLSDPGIYVGTEIVYGTERIATLKTSRYWKGYPFYGGVIFVLSSRSDLRNLSDLKSKKFAAPHPLSFAGWLAIKREMLHQKITPERFFSSLQFPGDDDRVVEAVLSGKVDAGSVRSGTLERLYQEGKIRLDEIAVINSKEEDYRHFPFLCSTELYPEWAFARLPHTDPALAEKISLVLLSIVPDDLAAVTGQYNGWTFPRNYQSVHDCLKELRAWPYKNYGKVTPGAVIKTYWPALVGAVILFGILLAILLYITTLNQSLRQTQEKFEREITERKKTEHLLRNSEQMLMRAYGEMEKKVEERTEELRKKLIELERFRKATIDREFRIKELENSLGENKPQSETP